MGECNQCGEFNASILKLWYTLNSTQRFFSTPPPTPHAVSQPLQSPWALSQPRVKMLPSKTKMYSRWSSFFQILPKHLIKLNKPICARILLDENNFNQFNTFY